MKRLTLALLLAAIAIAAYAGGTKESSPAANGPQAKPTTVKIWYYWENEMQQKILGTVVDTYNKSQSGSVVKTQYVPFADFKKQLSIGVVSESLPDIVIIDNPDHASYAAMGIFADLTDKLANWPDLKQYYPGPIASATLNGRLYGLPFGSNCLALYYRTDLFKAAGLSVPTTWDELKTDAKKLTTDKVFGLGVSALQNEEGTFQFMPWLWSTGATSFEINSAGGLKALNLYRDLIESGSMSKEVINWTQGDVMKQFISGNLAMMVNGPWQVPTMRKEAPDLKWDVALLPKDKEYASVLGGENFAIIKNNHVDASLAFLKFAASAKEVKSYINGFGYIASRRDVAENQFPNDPVMQTFAKAMQYAKPRGPHPRWPEISNAISTAFVSVIVGSASPQEAASKAQTTIDKIMSSAN
jgi:multiple sugar transport system substrate-binding protein